MAKVFGVVQEVAWLESVVPGVENVFKGVVLAHVRQEDRSAVATARSADQVVFYVARLVFGVLDSYEFEC